MTSAASVWHQAAELLARVPLSGESMQQRFASISRHRPSHLTTISAKKRKNASCNRYGNILPFDQNAVKVKAHAQEGSRGSYINASLVQQPEDDPLQWQYVATQGPLPHTVHTFWHMVVEQQCSAIVMLTEVAEGNATKCCQYFPQRTGDHLQEDDVTVECVSLEMLGVGRLEIEKRMMRVTLTSTGSAFVCAHYLMLTWPDHGAPTETHSIQELVRAVNDNLQAQPGVPCVHCSAGVGRTGTYITIDVVLRRLGWLAAQPTFSLQQVEWMTRIEELVTHLRTQRDSMVQSSEQLRFIYETLLHSCRQRAGLEPPLHA